MSWWYENEEEEMKLYKNEDLCIECKNEFFSKPYDHRDPTPGQLGYCIKCDNCLIKDKEKKMEFDRSRIYSAVNADELKAGDKVIVGSSLLELKTNVECNRRCGNIVEIGGECSNRRFTVDDVDGRGQTYWELAYLVERKENCLKCKKCEVISDKSMHCDWVGTGPITSARVEKCNHYEPKTEKSCTKCRMATKLSDGTLACDVDGYPVDCTPPHDEACSDYKPKKHYRPFRDTDELIKVFCEKTPKIYDKDDEKLFMPYIWVRNKENKRVWLITEFDNRLLDYLFTNCEFLDGSPCGVEE